MDQTRKEQELDAKLQLQEKERQEKLQLEEKERQERLTFEKQKFEKEFEAKMALEQAKLEKHGYQALPKNLMPLRISGWYLSFRKLK